MDADEIRVRNGFSTRASSVGLPAKFGAGADAGLAKFILSELDCGFAGLGL